VMNDPAFGASLIIANNLRDYRLSSHMISMFALFD